jgi:hypothetical protein
MQPGVEQFLGVKISSATYGRNDGHVPQRDKLDCDVVLIAVATGIELEMPR